MIRGYFKEKVYNTIIPRNIRLSEAPSYGKPITKYDTHSIGAKKYQELAQEVLAASERVSKSLESNELRDSDNAMENIEGSETGSLG